MGNKLRTAIVAVVLTAWTIGLVVPLVYKGFVLDPVYVNTLNGAFMAIVGIAAMSYNNHLGQGGQNTETTRRDNETRTDDEETTVD